MKIDNIQVTQPKRVEHVKSNLQNGNLSGDQVGQSIPQNQKNKTKEIKKTELEKALELVNDALKVADKKFDFELHEGTNRTMVKVIDRETEEIIREIPPKEILDLVEKMTELVGILMDKRV